MWVTDRQTGNAQGTVAHPYYFIDHFPSGTRDWNLLAPECGGTHVGLNTLCARVEVFERRAATGCYYRPTGSGHVAEIVQIPGEYPDPIATLLGFASIRIEDANAETVCFDKWPVQYAIRSNAVFSIADRTYER